MGGDRTVEEAHAAVQDSGGALRLVGRRRRLAAHLEAAAIHLHARHLGYLLDRTLLPRGQRQRLVVLGRLLLLGRCQLSLLLMLLNT